MVEVGEGEGDIVLLNESHVEMTMPNASYVEMPMPSASLFEISFALDGSLWFGRRAST